MNSIKNELQNNLLQLYQLRAIRHLKIFLEGELSLLFLLYNCSNSLNPTEIAHLLQVTKGRVTVILNSLSDKNYIDILIGTEDRRRFNVSLTNEGREYVLSKMIVADSYIDKMISIIGDEKTRLLNDILMQINTEMAEVE